MKAILRTLDGAERLIELPYPPPLVYRIPYTTALPLSVWADPNDLYEPEIHYRTYSYYRTWIDQSADYPVETLEYREDLAPSPRPAPPAQKPNNRRQLPAPTERPTRRYQLQDT